MKRLTTYLLTAVLLLLPAVLMAQAAGGAIKRPIKKTYHTQKVINHPKSKSIKSKTFDKQQEADGMLDVDTNIPQNKRDNNNTFAVIIANEKYTLAKQVPMAGNDGRVFAQYCEQTLGLPKENILLYTDATYGKMSRAIHDIKAIADAYEQKTRVIFFYTGLGVADESTRDAYIMPVDVDGSHIDVCYSLKKLYKELFELNVRSVIVFLDTCFGGWSGDGNSLLSSARGVVMKPNKEIPMGNMVVFNAVSGDEPAYDYPGQGHGLFTYYLLKKLQESKGDTNLGDLASFIIDNVKQKSIKLYKKTQIPSVFCSASLQNSWKMLKLR